MSVNFEEELFEICKEIVAENKSVEDWSFIESDDYFQTSHFCGGFDSIESAFCFSYYDENEEEYWFQITLDEVIEIFKNKKMNIKLRKADI